MVGAASRRESRAGTALPQHAGKDGAAEGLLRREDTCRRSLVGARTRLWLEDVQAHNAPPFKETPAGEKLGAVSYTMLMPGGRGRTCSSAQNAALSRMNPCPAPPAEI